MVQPEPVSTPEARRREAAMFMSCAAAVAGIIVSVAVDSAAAKTSALGGRRFKASVSDPDATARR
ncbi:MAG: hypothetical protein SangKO_014720 [Sandaracinaceae bacterium]